MHRLPSALDAVGGATARRAEGALEALVVGAETVHRLVFRAALRLLARHAKVPILSCGRAAMA